MISRICGSGFRAARRRFASAQIAPFSTAKSGSDRIGLPSLKSRLGSGQTLYGLFLLSSSPTLAEIAAMAGYDYVIIDMEHGPGGIPEALSCIRAVQSGGSSAILRLPESSQTWAKKALDLGPQGIMFPMIESAEAAREAVSFCLFRPRGIRGSAYSVVRDSRFGLDENYLRNYTDKLLIMCQVESEEGVNNIEGIASTDGLDCIQMGPRDLSASMGYLHDPGNSNVKEMMRKAENNVFKMDRAKGGAYMAGMVTAYDGADDLRAWGYHMVAGGVDIGMFRAAAVEDVKRFHGSGRR